jgi:CCR4-NOT transcription complex subunit 1
VLPTGITPAVTTAYKTITQTTVTTTTTVAVSKATTTSVISSRVSCLLLIYSVDVFRPGILFLFSLILYFSLEQPSIANATNIDTLLVATEKEEKMTAPPDTVQDKVAFIFNNLSQLNLQTKVSS